MQASLKLKNNNETRLIMMIILSLGGQLVSLYKSIYTAQFYGTSDAMDAYNYATNLGTFIFDFIASGIATVILPAYVKKVKDKSINSFITIIYGVVSAVLIIVYLLRRPLINALTDRNNAFNDAFCQYVFIAFLIQACISMVLVLSAYFQSKDMYVIPRIVLLISNMAVLCALLLIGEMPIEAFFRIIFIGAFLNLVINYILAKHQGFSFRPALSYNDAETQSLLALFTPTLLSCGVFKIHTLIDTMITTNIGTGMLTILTYSSQVSGMISNFVIANMLTFAYPQIIRGTQTENRQKELWKYVVLFHAIICLLVAGFLAVGEYGINLLYVKGEFSRESGQILFIGSLLYLASQILLIIRDLVFRFFYAMENTKDTVTNSIVSCLINILLSIIFVVPFGMYGVILGTIISGGVSMVMILFRMKKLYGIEDFTRTTTEILKNMLTLCVTIISVELIKRFFIIENNLGAILVYGTITVMVFAVSALLFKLKAIKTRL